ncbi:Uncharacterised protein [Streptomyces griseus]|nr:Uncharacterised protein [Streptomyces griseus]
MGAGFLAAAFLAGALFAGAADFLGAVFLAGAAFFAGPGVRPTRFAAPAAPWEPLPDVREAMVPRLPLSSPVNTFAYWFTRPCRLRGAGN